MQAQFNARCFKVTSPNPEVKYVIIERDDMGWKMDVVGKEHNEWPDGDTYQDSVDELMPFLAKYADQNSFWSDYETGERTTFWEALLSVTGTLD
jgi:hypothetical protein